MGKMLALLLVICTVLTGCKGRQAEQVVNLPTDDFINVEWTRNTESCTETLCFREDGTCSYYCACGEPVNDDDLCEGYRYDPETKTVYLIFSETTDETITQCTVKSCDGQTLVLDFGGQERIFERAGTELAPTDTLSYGGETYCYLSFPGDIFYYDLREAMDYEEDAVLPIPHDRWKLVYRDGDLFVLESQWETAVADYADDENYTWSVLVEDPQTEETHVVPVTVSADDRAFIYNMENIKGDTTLFFDDIELFGSLVKTHKDGVISASTSLAYHADTWYWRSETIDDSVEGWPEYVVPLPNSITAQISQLEKG